MAEVFEAELAGELGFVRKVAIKRMLPAAAANAEAAGRFLDEARIASRLHHANIVSVVDVGLLEGLPFQVLEYIDGLNVEELIHRAGGQLPVEVALIIAADIAHGLDHAHNAVDEHGHPAGIVHRDVKPSNAMVSWSGDVKLGDFGIAFARARSAHTQIGIVVGTTGFIAPEQLIRSEVDGRADVFALGLTLHAMLTGYTPLRDPEAELAVVTGVPVPLDPGLPEEVRDLISRAVAPQRLDRPTANELAGALGAALAPRLTRDPRGHLRAYLDGLRPEPRPGLLDRLFDVEPVPSGVDEPEPYHRFQLRPPTPLRRTTIDAPTRPDHPTRPARPPSPAVPARRSPAWIAAAALAITMAGGVALWRGARSIAAERSPRGADATVVAAVAIDAAAAPMVAPADAADLAPPVDAAAAISIRHSPGASVVARSPGAVAPPAVPVGTGFVNVGGEGKVGAKILVDGAFVTYAPHRLELRLGRHRIQLELKDGTLVPISEVIVTEYNTFAHPATVTF